MAFCINPIIADVLDPPTGETRAWVEAGPRNSTLNVIDAAQAVPAYPPAEALRQHLSRIVQEPESAFYTPILGLSDLRKELAHDLSSEYHANINLEHVGIASGGNHAFCTAILALAAPGDNVILPEPFYFNHQMWFEMQGVDVQHLPCRETDRGMLPFATDAEALINPRTRAIVLISPNNPTGTIYSKEHIHSFYELARAHNLALIIDETYKDFLPTNEPAHDLFNEPDWEDVFVQLYSFSKVYSLTGYRVGSITAGGRLMAAISKIADTLTICAPRIGQEAALFGLRHLSEWRSQKNAELQARIAILHRAFAEHSPPFPLVSSGAFFAYVKHPFTGTPSLDVSRRLFDDLALLTWPGSFFGNGQEDYVRLAFANAGEADIEEMVRRLSTLST